MLGDKRYWFESGITKIGHGCWARLIKRDIARDILFDVTLPIGEDIVWNLEALQKCVSVCVAETVWYGYYYHMESACRRFRANAVTESKDSLNRMAEYLDMSNDGEYYAYCSRAYTDLYRLHQTFLRNTESKLSSKERRNIESSIYNDAPWVEIKNKRFISMCKFKDRLFLFLYRIRLLFMYYYIRDKVKKG